MMDYPTFLTLVRHIQDHGYSREDACRLAAQVGDTPMLDGDKLVLIDNGLEVASVPCPPMFLPGASE